MFAYYVLCRGEGIILAALVLVLACMCQPVSKCSLRLHTRLPASVTKQMCPQHNIPAHIRHHEAATKTSIGHGDDVFLMFLAANLIRQDFEMLIFHHFADDLVDDNQQSLLSVLLPRDDRSIFEGLDLTHAGAEYSCVAGKKFTTIHGGTTGVFDFVEIIAMEQESAAAVEEAFALFMQEVDSERLGDHRVAVIDKETFDERVWYIVFAPPRYLLVSNEKDALSFAMVNLGHRIPVHGSAASSWGAFKGFDWNTGPGTWIALRRDPDIVPPDLIDEADPCAGIWFKGQISELHESQPQLEMGLRWDRRQHSQLSLTLDDLYVGRERWEKWEEVEDVTGYTERFVSRQADESSEERGFPWQLHVLIAMGFRFWL